MSKLSDLRHRAIKAWPFQTLPTLDWSAQGPMYREADPGVIRAAVARAQCRPSGNWFAFAATRRSRPRPGAPTVGGSRSWPGAEPMERYGWRLARVRISGRTWPLPRSNAERWCARGTVCGSRTRVEVHGNRFPAHDDGVLCWVRLDAVGKEEPTDAPIIPGRPPSPRLAAVTRLEGVCEPCDVVANRLDPWHGAWFHPYSFTRLEVLSSPAADEDLPDELDRFVVAVTFRCRLGVPVIAEFTTPDPRTVVVQIIDGEGQGSVVETHVTPPGIGPDGVPRTAVVEAVIGYSDRRHFGKALFVGPAIRPLIGIAAKRLGRDDLAHAERLFELRS